jgi:hypothetical protein
LEPRRDKGFWVFSLLKTRAILNVNGSGKVYRLFLTLGEK